EGKKTTESTNNLSDIPVPYIAAIETYGSNRLNPVMLKNFLGKDLDLWVEKGLEGDPISLKLEAKLIEKIQKRFDFASADWSIVQYFEPSDMALYLTLDVVEKADVSTRMDFEKPPSQTFE